MFYNYSNMPNVNNPYAQNYYPMYHHNTDREQSIRGQATWTGGGQVTQCGIPWADNEYMTVAVGENSPYQCGQTIKVRNLSSSKEVLVTVVDQVPGYPSNRINLHRKAFEALGANPSVGVINVEITPSPELEQEEWGKYLLEVTQTAYPGYNVIEYNLLEKAQESQTRTRETYEFVLQSPPETIQVRGNVVYNPNTDRVISFDISEI